MLKVIKEILEGILRALQGPKPTPRIRVTGIGTASAYASGDAFGAMLSIPVPKFGTTILGARFFDYDDEGLGKILYLSSRPFSATADNSPISISDADQQASLGHITISGGDFVDWGASREATVTNVNLPYYAPEGTIYCQIQTLGADNIAAGSEPDIQLLII